LNQAKAAIKEGNLEQADALVRRAERAGIRYPFMHFGATPASVRRELAQAQKLRPAPRNNAARPASEGMTPATAASNTKPAPAISDPFLRSDTAAPAHAPIAESTNTSPSVRVAGESAPVTTGSAGETPVGRAVVNPFSSQANSPNPSGRYGQLNTGANSVLQTGYGGEPTLTAPDGSAALPSAPLPPKIGASRGAAPSATKTAGAGAGSELNPTASAKEETLSRLAAARQALGQGDTDLAERLAREASSLGVPESQFLPHEDRPSLVTGDILRAQRTSPVNSGRQSVTHADLNQPIKMPRYTEPSGPAINPDAGANSRYSQGAATSPATEPHLSTLPDPLELPSTTAPAGMDAYPRITSPITERPLAASGEAARLLRDGEAALSRHDRATALELFGRAQLVREQLAPAEQQRLRDHLQMLSSPPASVGIPGPTPRRLAALDQQTVGAPQGVVSGGSFEQTGDSEIPPPQGQDATPRPLQGSGSILDAANAQGQVLARQLQAEVGRSQTEARRLREQDPQQALDLIKATRQKVADAHLTDDVRNQLLRRLDVTLEQTQHYIDDHRAEIELDQKNKAVLAEVDRGRELKLKLQQKIAEMVDEFNRLRDEQRYSEMEVVARRLYEMAPEEPIAQQIWQMAKFIRREIMNRQLADQKETSIYQQLHATETSAINPVAEDGKEMVFDQKYWTQLKVKDRKSLSDVNSRRTERELEIERRLQTPVRPRYQNTPLSQVADELSQLAGINIHLDPRGLSQEGWQSDTPVTITLNTDISLKSALNLILAPLHLSYVIKDEVLQITSEQLRDGELVTFTYPVADLVIPIPNFVPSSNMGLQGLISDAYAAMGRGPNGIGAGPAVLVGGERGGTQGTGTNDNVLAQQFNKQPGFGPTTGSLTPTTVPVGSGPGGLGGGASADFDSLIELIVSTVATETWAEQGGGTAEVRAFPTNLSLVISQTQAVHQEIADLLEQLRRLQDLQVTIEVRFIRLNDSFFERVGIDFDMNIEDRTIGTADLVPGFPWEGGRQTALVGMQQSLGLADFPRFTNDLDVPFRQNSFALTEVVPFGNFPGAGIGSFGFAILSDIEAYFLIEAAQGDRRTNVLNAPKVTLFNGQQAFVTDATQTPFVVGVIPVVGEFVAAQQPVIAVLSEGTTMTIQAVVSDDRRYVRMTIVPYFTQIGDVDEFTFEGSSSSTSSSSTTDDDDDGKNEKSEKNDEQTRSGVTVQLPSFQQVSVVTTVSVPDGGTVLLGGIKRLSEGRNEFGVPLLSKIPYINRLFKNVSIGRETDSLMMMVTPRIIIQEEEEQRLGDISQ
jgi:general secretion pathway protein D